MKIDKQDLLATLTKVWGYQDFRYPQTEVIQTLLARQDSLVVIPTGRGKSLCFQLPALLQPGLTIVVSPLVALMENQVQQLTQKQIAAGLIHSQQNKSDRNLILANLRQLKLLYLAPETLLTLPIWEKLCQRNLVINNLIVDEAHCLVEWGSSFRPSYNRLGIVRKSLEIKHSCQITLTAFTATADKVSQQIISQSLGLKKPQKFILSPYRSNLQLQFQTVWTPKGRKQKTFQFIKQQQKKSGLIYVRSRQNSEYLAQWFEQQGFKTAAYHAGIISSQRRLIEREWLQGKLQFVICTSAFGMGIDKPNCHFILHYHSPQLLTEYLQEIGRGGRDNRLTPALTLLSEPTGLLDSEDKQRDRFFRQQINKKYRQAQQIFKQLPDRGNVLEIGNQIPQSEIGLGILQNLGLIAWRDPFNYYKKKISKQIANSPANQSAQNLHHRTPSFNLLQQSKIMSDFLKTRKCRWQYILNTFSLTQQAQDFRCGICDRCLTGN